MGQSHLLLEHAFLVGSVKQELHTAVSKFPRTPQAKTSHLMMGGRGAAFALEIPKMSAIVLKIILHDKSI